MDFQWAVGEGLCASGGSDADAKSGGRRGGAGATSGRGRWPTTFVL